MALNESTAPFLGHPYSRLLPKVAKPNRYTGAEHGAIHKDWSAVSARVCLAFPDVYDIGMSHLGFRILYKILNDDPEMLAERCYTPWVDMQRELRAHGKLLGSLESVRPLCDFDVVGFSLQYELTYTNVLAMLDLGGIPLKAQHRSNHDPLIVGGGPVATHMEPMSPFFDAVLIGDGEEATREIVRTWVAGKNAGLDREQRLAQLANIRGVYVPSLYTTELDPKSGLEVVSRPTADGPPFPVERRLVEDINQYPFPSEGPVGGPEAIFDRMSIEVARGCTEGCRFCQAGMIYRPVRERDPEVVVDTVLEALKKSGQDEVSLTALSTADVSCISPLIKTLVERTAPERVSLSVASLRAYGLSEEILDDMRKVRAAGLTFAPEAGTQRMRDVINKNVTEEQLLETAERVFSRGFDKMKLYFILGLPTETEEDVLGILEVGKNALAVGRRVGKRPKLTVSVSTHVPKPHTPFQWCAMDAPDVVRQKQRLLREAARQVRGLSLKLHECETSVLEGIFARGDRKLAPVIERAYQNGARFDSWEDQQNLEVWREAFEHFAIDTERYLATLPIGARLPWDHIDVGLEDGFLAREYRKAVNSRLSPPCGKVKGMFVHHDNADGARADQRRLVCYDCGVACDMTDMRQRRIDFLERMGAHEKLVPEARLSAPRPARGGAPPERYRPKQRAGRVVRYRLRYGKTGATSLLGHLDLIRELGRVIRRAGVHTAYTEGFHPKPDMSFGPALSLGVLSTDEYLDVKLVEPPEPEQLLERLNAAAAGGLVFLGALPLEAGVRPLGRIITHARYLIRLAPGSFEARPADYVQGKVEAFLARESVRVIRKVKGLGKPIDVRSVVTSLRLCPEQDGAVSEVLPPASDAPTLELTLSTSASGSAKLSEVVEAVFGEVGLPFLALRTGLLADGENPFDVARRSAASPGGIGSGPAGVAVDLPPTPPSA